MEFDVAKSIEEFFEENKIEYENAVCEKFDDVCTMLIDFNNHTNVTALKSRDDICRKHFQDSLYPLKYNLFPKGAKVIDIGCGAGFPGLPLKMAREDIDMSFVDSTAKKLRFTQSVCEKYGYDAKFYPERAEDLCAKGHREKYDFAVSRAVASLPVLLELVMPYVKVGGAFIAYKSKKECDLENKESELSKSKNALKTLCAKVENVLDASFEDKDGVLQEHCLMVIRKTAKTPTNYPRRYAVIVKKPL